ncbi:Ribose-5-phosphate isomerase A [Deinococcus proteolyticus MRP]|uniref:Ribose-5-phosphate isomerase A n=1 Tax=Deinococcus proteolyticus (strain ATCC 35074 / DSM 20540 / JCM 6276 / NBRC 101906 / NCIMB 13154 / VKM Ac-1939 / CCM 2703 / MRP) TaxID=693977 RepID=F0RLG0_DEIPM|nr:ribose 5-phosphate isomerase A [Deinococcus proteolyticus]ADY25864.1 Ribose-5-phosphate isomerase A [Deinococcus proteolyticus MRP]
MSDQAQNLEALKKEAALKAVALVQSGQRVGLGTGSTAKYAIEELGRKLRDGELSGIVGVATSNASADLAREVGIPVEDLDPRPLDIAIDGADEIAPNLDLIKGLGGALLREKLTEVQARRLIIIADHTKIVSRLGEKAPLPIEIAQFGFLSTVERLREFLPGGRLRMTGASNYVTDNGNFIYDAQLPADFAPAELERRIKGTLGVVDTGLFLCMAERAFVAAPDGVQELVR